MNVSQPRVTQLKYALAQALFNVGYAPHGYHPPTAA